MPKSDGKITLSLNVKATEANFNSQLNSILARLKKKVTLDANVKIGNAKNDIDKIRKYAKSNPVMIKARLDNGAIGKNISKIQNQMNKGMRSSGKNGMYYLTMSTKEATDALKKHQNQLTKTIATRKQFEQGLNQNNVSKSDARYISNLREQERLLGNIIEQDKKLANGGKAVSAVYKSNQKEFDKYAKSAAKYKPTDYGNGFYLKSSMKSIESDLKKRENIVKRNNDVIKNINDFNKNKPFTDYQSSQIKALEAESKAQQKVIDKEKSFIEGRKVQREAFLNDIKDASEKSSQIDKSIRSMDDSERVGRLYDKIAKTQNSMKRYQYDNTKFMGDKNLRKEWGDITTNLNNARTEKEFKAVNRQLDDFKTKVKLAGKEGLTFGQRFRKAFVNFGTFVATSRVFYDMIRGVSAMATNVKNLDTAMVELRKVTDASGGEFDSFLERAKTNAVEIGSTVTDLVNSTADFSRLGYSFGDAEELAKVATIYNNVGDGLNGIDDATNIIITTMKAFNMEADDAITIVDKLNEIGNNYAISSGALGQGFTNAASYLATSGNTLDESLAMITAMTEITQDASESGNALKILAMRLRGAKTELSDMGEDTEGMVESTSKLREKIMALTAVNGKEGFDIMQDENTFKSTYDIMKGISEVFDDMSNINQAALIELIAGKNRGNSITALLTSMGQAENILNTSLNSAGSAYAEQEIWMDSIEAKINQLKAAFEALSSTIISSDFAKGFLDFVTKGTTGIDDFVKNLNGFGGVLLTIGGIIATMKSSKIVDLFSRTGSKFGDFRSKIKDFRLDVDTSIRGTYLTLDDYEKKGEKKMSKIGKGFKSLGAGISSIASFIDPATAAFGALTVGLTAYEMYQAKIEERHQKAVSGATSYKQVASGIEEYKNKLIELREQLSSGDLTPEQSFDIRAEILNLQNEIVDTYGEEAANLDLVNGKLSEQLDLVSQIGGAERQNFLNENYKEVNKAVKQMGNAAYSIDGIGKDAVKGNTYNAWKDIFGDSLQTSFDRGKPIGYTLGGISTEEAYNKTNQLIERLQDEQSALKEGSKEYEQYSKSIRAAQEFSSQLGETIGEYSEIYNIWGEEQLSSNKNYSDYYEKYLDSVKKMDEALASGDEKAGRVGYENAIMYLEKLKEAADGDKDTLNYLNQELDNLRNTSEGKFPITDTINSMANTAKQSAKEIFSAYEDEAGKIDWGKIAEASQAVFEGTADADVEKNYRALLDLADAFGVAPEGMKAWVESLNALGTVSENFSTLEELSTNYQDAVKAFSEVPDSEEAKKAIEDTVKSLYEYSPEDLQSRGLNINQILGLDQELDLRNLDEVKERYAGIQSLLKQSENGKISLDASEIQQAQQDAEVLAAIFKEITGEEIDTKDLANWFQADDRSLKEIRDRINDEMSSDPIDIKAEVKDGKKFLSKFEGKIVPISLETKVNSSEYDSFVAKAEKRGINVKVIANDTGRTAAELERKISTAQISGVKTKDQSYNIKANVTGNAETKIDSINKKLKGLNKTVNAKVNATVSGKSNIDDLASKWKQIKTKTVTLSVKTVGNALGTYNKAISNLKKSGQTNRTYSEHDRRSSYQAVHKAFSGRANAVGSNQIQKSGTSLVGELGQELLVRPSDGTWRTIGNSGPEFIPILKGDIIYNAKQTRQLLSGQKVTVGGSAYANGTILHQTTALTPTRSIIKNGTVPVPNINIDDTALEEKLKDALDNIKKAADRIIGDYDFTISIMEYKNSLPKDMIAIYEKMQNSVNAKIKQYRAKGLSDNSDFIQDLQKQWYEYAEKIQELRIKEYEDVIKNNENAIDLTKIWMENSVDDNDYSKVRKYASDITTYYKNMQEAIHKEAAYYRSLGYSDTSDEVSELSKKWWEYQRDIEDLMEESFNSIVENARDSLDKIADVYDKLRDAADEYAESSTISIGTLSDILELGAEYVSLLKDENGKLIINENSIQDVIKARTQQLGVETALNYIEQLRVALTNKDTAAMNGLLAVTKEQSKSTWELVYAQLKFLNLSNSQYEKALQNVNKIHALTDEASFSVGKNVKDISSGLEDILDYVIEIIEQETEDKIDALEDQVDEYEEIIKRQKESLKLTKEQNEYDKEVSEKVKEISKLEARIQQLSMDDSREAYAKRVDLEEQLAKLQEELNDYQADKAYDATVDSLDKQLDAYKQEKDKEKEALEDSISSYEKRYRLAIEKIRSMTSDELFAELISWNEQYGNDLNNTIVKAWENANAAIEKYKGNLADAIEATNGTSLETATENNGIVADSNDYAKEIANNAMIKEIVNLVGQMQANGNLWHNATAEGRKLLESRNEKIAQQITDKIGVELFKDSSGVWHIGSTTGNKLYDSYQTDSGTTYTDLVKQLANQMKSNSTAWNTASASKKTELASKNKTIASQLEDILGAKIERGSDGTWYIGGANSGVELYKYYGSRDSSLVPKLVSQMKQNSASWSSASESQRAKLSQANLDISRGIAYLLGQKVVRGSDGTWYIGKVGGTKLFDKYHSGGIVGGNGTARDNEVFALLEKGEAVLDQNKKNGLYEMVDMQKEFGNLFSGFVSIVSKAGNKDLGYDFKRAIQETGNQIIGRQGGNLAGATVDASVKIYGDVDSDAWKKIYPVLQEHKKQVAEIVNKETTALLRSGRII